MKKFLFAFFTLVLGGSLFVFAINQVGWQTALNSLTLLSFGELFLIAVVMATGFLFSVWRWIVIIRSQEQTKLSFFKLLLAKNTGFSLNYLTPTAYFGGEPLRAFIAKEELDLDWDKNIFSIVVDKAFEITTNFLLVLIGMVYLYFFVDLPVWMDWTLIAVLVVSLAILSTFYFRSVQGRGFFSSFISLFWLNKIKTVKGLSGDIKKIEQYTHIFFTQKKKYFSRAVILSIVSRTFSFFSAWLIVYFLGIDLSIGQFMGFVAITAAIYFIPIPGGLGAHEASQAIIFSLFGFGAGNGIAFSILMRILQLAGVLAGLIGFIYFQIKMWLRALGLGIEGFFDKIKHFF